MMYQRAMDYLLCLGIGGYELGDESDASNQASVNNQRTNAPKPVSMPRKNAVRSWRAK